MSGFAGPDKPSLFAPPAKTVTARYPSVRPEKEAWNVGDSVHEIRRLSGTQFDPAVVDAFNQLNADQLAGHTPTNTYGRLVAVS